VEERRIALGTPAAVLEARVRARGLLRLGHRSTHGASVRMNARRRGGPRRKYSTSKEIGRTGYARRFRARPRSAAGRPVTFKAASIVPPGGMGSAVDDIAAEWQDAFRDVDSAGHRPAAVSRITVLELRIQEVQLLLAEKRTALSTLRTGLGVIAAPLTVVSFLVVTSHFYDVLASLWLLAPLLALCVVLVVLGSYLIMRAIVRIHQFDDRIRAIKATDPELRSLIIVD